MNPTRMGMGARYHWWGEGVRGTQLKSLSTFSPSAISWTSLFLPSPPGWALPSPSLLRHFMLKNLFQLSSLLHIPSPLLGTSGALPNTSAPVPLAESHRCDCWAGLKCVTPRVLPPPAVTAAAALALPACTMQPTHLLLVLFLSLLLPGMWADPEGKWEPWLNPTSLTPRTPQVPHGRHGQATVLCMGGMIPSIKGPPSTMQHPKVSCPCPPSVFLSPA